MNSGLPVIFGRDDISYVTCADENGIIEDKQDKFKINDRLMLVPGHFVLTCNLHDWNVCERDGTVVDSWPVSARGRHGKIVKY